MDDLEHAYPSTDSVVSRRAGYVVGIGASAGGLEALEHFFDNVSSDTELAFVVVQHLSPDFKSLMDELLGRHTKLPIHLVEDAMIVEGGHVYLIPPKKEMIISGGRLLLTERDLQQELALPIDVFFRSLAQDCGSGAIAVVLSGSGSDGSRGICDVHAAGGTVIVQDLDSAQFGGMPRTATETGIVDFILAPQNIPRVLEEKVRRGATVGAGAVSPPPRSARSMAFSEVYRLLENEFGIDFTHYKPSTVTRRIERRLRLSDVDGIEQYVEHLSRERTELDVLYRDLLIGVTRFFRNEEAFAVLQQRVLPELIENVAPTKPIRVWVAGCATGEEPYSIAILLHELLAELPGRSFKIFATDMHRGSLELAARGFFGAAALANVSQERKDRYFIKSGASYQLLPELRQSIVFAPHNVIKDAPFTRVDLVSCRNMLIYLQPAVQQKVLNQFHFALNRGGVMFLGPSESPGALIKDFETIDAHWRMYRKHSDVRTPVDPRLQPKSPVRTAPPAITGPFARYSMSHLLATYDALLEDYMPSSLLVNDRGELVHAFRGASQFLKPRDGRQGLEVSELVDDQLKPLITGGLRRALLAPAPLTFKNVQLTVGGTEQVFNIGLRRVAPRHTEVPHVLITFDQLDGAPIQPAAATEIDLGQLSRDQLGSLQHELDYTKENLQSAIEQLEAGNEELQASNEELMSSNEELQSTNEELQSVNEELYTVNAEYQSKIGELTELTNDMDNLLASTEIATIFLDEKLKIRKFTPQVAESFNLLSQDVGRSIESFTSTIEHPELGSDIRRVLATTERLEREVRDQHGRALFLRILPYRAKGGTAGAVITFVDVSGLKAAEDALFHERYLLNSLLASVPDAIYFRDTKGRFIRTNPAATARLGVENPAQAVGKTPFELTDPKTAIAMYQKDDEVLRTGQPQLYELESWSRRDGRLEWDLVTRLPLVDATKQTVGIIGIARDVTAQKTAEEKIQEAVRRRDEFLAMLSHELRNPLAAVVAATELMKGDLSKVPELPQLVDVLDRQAHQMARLLDDLLDASRVTQNKIELRTSPLDVRTVIEDALSATRVLIEAQGHSLTVALGDAPLTVMGDPSRLQQVYANLLTNAAKYTPNGGHIWLEAGTEGQDAVVSVRDDGVGIAPEMLDAIFDLFVQPNRTLDRSQGGLGVGLTLARSLTVMHGGTLQAKSNGEGRGSTFTVRLPLSSARPAEERPAPAARVEKGARVVVVEDNVDAREMLCHLLTKAGFDCESVGDGLAAVELIEKFKPRTAIVDVGLPGIDGFEVARRVRSVPALEGVALIALTGYGQHNDRAKALEAGFNAHMVKPVKFEELMKLLTK